VVTLHLLGGFTTLALISLLNLRINQYRLFKNLSNYSIEQLPTFEIIKKLKKLTIVCLALIAVQISLGGWTAANYAALPCTDFPTCQGSLWPTMDFKSGFNISQTIGPNYLGGQLDGPSRTAIHVTHRIGALCVTLFSLILIVALYRSKFFYHCAILLALAVTIQIALGIANVLLVTPLSIAVLHNLFGAVLLLTVVYCWFNLTEYTKQRSTELNL
jgi:cytochrome c oxidase assembly protein subunit 15